MADRFEQWSRARLGEYVTVDGETHATIIVPVDGEHHDPRVDVIKYFTRGMEREAADLGAALAGIGGELKSGTAIATVANIGVEHAEAEAEKPPTARHRKTRGK